MSLLAAWQHAKDTFEKTTGKKKPSAKTMLGFRKSSGIEDSLKAIDKAKSQDDLDRAVKAFKSARSASTRVLDANKVDAESSASYADEVRKLEDALKSLEREAEQIDPPGVERSMTVGPLRFKLLDGVRCTSLEIAGDTTIDVVIAIEFKAGDLLKAARFQETVSDFVNEERDKLKKLVEAADHAIGELTKFKGYVNANHRAERLANAERLAQEVNDYLQHRKSEIVKQAEARVNKLAKEMSNREVDLEFLRIRTAVKVGFGVVKVATAARKLFTDPPGLSILTTVFSMAKELWGVVKELRTAFSGLETLRAKTTEEINGLEQRRQLHIKENKSKGEAAKDFFNQVREALLNDIEGAKRYLVGFEGEVTKFEKKANGLSGSLNQMLSVQKLLNREEPEMEKAIGDCITRIQQMHASFGQFLEEVKNFKGALAGLERDTSKPVQLAKGIVKASSWLDTIGALENITEGLMDRAQKAMKK